MRDPPNERRSGGMYQRWGHGKSFHPGSKERRMQPIQRDHKQSELPKDQHPAKHGLNPGKDRFLWYQRSENMSRQRCQDEETVREAYSNHLYVTFFQPTLDTIEVGSIKMRPWIGRSDVVVGSGAFLE